VTSPDRYLIDKALELSRQSPCQKSKRGVVVWDPANGEHRGGGFNGPPGDLPCVAARDGQPSSACHCSLRCIHAEMRAIDEARGYIARHHPPGPYDLLHVELAPDGGVVACNGPTCAQCSKHIVECGFVGRVWLFERDGCAYCDANTIAPDRPELRSKQQCGRGHGGWRSYDVAEFHRLSLLANGATP